VGARAADVAALVAPGLGAACARGAAAGGAGRVTLTYAPA